MTKAEMLEKLQKHWKRAIETDLERFYHHPEQYISLFQKRIGSILQEAEGLEEPVVYITISQLLRSFWIHDKAVFSVRMYGEALDIKNCLLERDISFDEIYGCFLNLYRRALEECRQYAGKVTIWDVKEYFMKQIEDWNAFLEWIAYYALASIPINPSIQLIWIGKEYQSRSYGFLQRPVYANIPWRKGDGEWEALCKDWELEELSFHHFQNMELGNCNESFCYQYFQMSRFTRCSFMGVPMQNSLFIQCQFLNCHFPGTDFTASSLCGSWFQGCNLKGCKFSQLHTLKGYERAVTVFHQVDLTEALFENVDFQHIRFYHSHLQGTKIPLQWKNSPAFYNTETNGVQWI